MALNYCFLTRNRQRREKNAGGPQHGRKTLSRSLKRTKLHFAQGFPMLRWKISAASESRGTNKTTRHCVFHNSLALLLPSGSKINSPCLFKCRLSVSSPTIRRRSLISSWPHYIPPTLLNSLRATLQLSRFWSGVDFKFPLQTESVCCLSCCHVPPPLVCTFLNSWAAAI